MYVPEYDIMSYGTFGCDFSNKMSALSFFNQNQVCYSEFEWVESQLKFSCKEDKLPFLEG